MAEHTYVARAAHRAPHLLRQLRRQPGPRGRGRVEPANVGPTALEPTAAKSLTAAKAPPYVPDAEV